jgi:hypothetical protein
MGLRFETEEQSYWPHLHRRTGLSTLVLLCAARQARAAKGRMGGPTPA